MFNHKYAPSVEAASVVSVLSFMAMCVATFIMSI
jgi:hypothetical protein